MRAWWGERARGRHGAYTNNWSVFEVFGEDCDLGAEVVGRHGWDVGGASQGPLSLVAGV